MTCARYSLVAVVLTPCLLGVLATDAQATSSSESIINGTTFLTDSGETSSSVVSGGNGASSFVTPLTETMGASVNSDGTAFSVRTSTSHTDSWCPQNASCDAVFPPFDLSATISFDAVIGGNIAQGRGEFDLVAKYTLGPDAFRFEVSADSTPISAGATWNGDDIPVTVTTDAAGNVHVSTSLTRQFVCPCFAVNQPLFIDNQSMQLEMEGSGFVDASHTFTVSLTPVDPNLAFISADGRTAGSAPAASPVPEPASLLLLGTCLLPLARRLRRV
jgi:hypothetical protein